MRPRTFSELLLQLINEEGRKKDFYFFEVPGIAYKVREGSNESSWSGKDKGV